MMHAISRRQFTKMGAGVGTARPLMVNTCLGGETAAHRSKPIQFCLECRGLGSRRGIACPHCNGTGSYIPISDIDEEALAFTDRLLADERRTVLRLVRDQQCAFMRVQSQELAVQRERAKQKRLPEKRIQAQVAKQERQSEKRLRDQVRMVVAAEAHMARERARQVRTNRVKERAEARRRIAAAREHQQEIERQRTLRIAQEVAESQGIEQEQRIQEMVKILEQENRSRRRRQADAMYERYMQYRLWFSTLKSEIGCQCCDEVESVSLDFYHIDRQSKSFGLGLGKWSTSHDRIRAEMEKCLLLCSNCHRRVTAESLDVSHLQAPDYDAAWQRVEHLRPLTEREKAERRSERSDKEFCG